MSGGVGGQMSDLKEMGYQRKISILEDKLKQAMLDMKHEFSLRELTDANFKELENHN
jgi:hypothetical protein